MLLWQIANGMASTGIRKYSRKKSEGEIGLKSVIF